MKRAASCIPGGDVTQGQDVFGAMWCYQLSSSQADMPWRWAPAPEGTPSILKENNAHRMMLLVALYMSPQMGSDLNVYPRENEK